MKQIREVELQGQQFLDDEHPMILYILKSGFENQYIVVTETPFIGLESSLKTLRQIQQIYGITPTF